MRMTQEREFHVRTQRIEQLVSQLENASDPELHTAVLELVQSVMELHGAALDHILDVVSQSAEGELIAGKLLEDDLVSSVLLLHGLHPEEMETRVLRALDKVRPSFQSSGGNVELVSIEEGIVRLRVQQDAGGCASTAVTMKNAVEDAVKGVAPDAAQILAEVIQQPAPSKLVVIT
jgi:Fe-S cluster biogenesis protein NfuA